MADRSRLRLRRARRPGLSGFINYAQGETPDRGAKASADQEEFDLTLDYRFQAKPLNGLWLRARAAFLDEKGGVTSANDRRDYRVILNYELPLL
jgi:hypothetical protein